MATNFVLKNALQAGRFSFEGYNDKNGDFHYIPGGKDKDGNEVAKFFHWQTRTFTANNEKVAEFLRNSPFCEGSPNAEKGMIYYYEYNPEKDALKSIEAKKKIAKAMNVALELEGEELTKVARLCGTFDTNPAIQQQKVFDTATSDPEGFLEMVTSKNSEVKSLFLGAKDRGVITVKGGFMLMWKDVHLGNSESEALQKLMIEPELKSALQQAYEAAKTQPTVNKVNGSNAKSKGR